MTDKSFPKPTGEISELLKIMKALRDPETGCPWDKVQSFATIAPYTIEEAYEVADAIGRADMADLREELGDLLLQVVYHAQMASEEGHFTFEDVVASISTKMIDRHPHVFGDADIKTADALNAAWEKAKAEEALKKADPTAPFTSSRLDTIAKPLPALTQAEKISKRVARVGFDWPDIASVLAKVREELDEIEEAVASGGAQEALHEEMGDLLFATTNLARHMKVDPEQALRDGNIKFVRRFRAIEKELLKGGKNLDDASLEEMEAAWRMVKNGEKA